MLVFRGYSRKQWWKHDTRPTQTSRFGQYHITMMITTVIVIVIVIVIVMMMMMMMMRTTTTTTTTTTMMKTMTMMMPLLLLLLLLLLMMMMMMTTINIYDPYQDHYPNYDHDPIRLFQAARNPRCWPKLVGAGSVDAFLARHQCGQDWRCLGFFRPIFVKLLSDVIAMYSFFP